MYMCMYREDVTLPSRVEPVQGEYPNSAADRVLDVQLTMSDSEQDASVLGKRIREGESVGQENGQSDAEQGPPQPADNEDDDDDDVGPMPIPAEAVGGSVKKKRKGVCIIHFRCC